MVVTVIASKSASVPRTLLATLLTILLVLAGNGVTGWGAREAMAQSPEEATTVGFYPTDVVYPQALRGGTFTQRVGLIVGGHVPQTFRFSTLGAIGNWLTVLPLSGPKKPLQSLEALPGDTDLVLQLEVPSHAADGNYRGTLVVQVPPGKGAKGTSAVGFGAEIKVTAEVTGTEILAARLLDAYTYPKVEVGSPVTFFARVDNSGNVAVTPVFHIRVSRGKTVTFDDITSPATLQPSTLSTLQLAWPASETQVAPLGLYKATISARFGHLNLGSIATQFKLVPYGSLHRSGELTSLKLLNRPVVGGYAEVRASVLSTGEAPEQTSFVGQLYRGSSLVEPVKSPLPILLQPTDRPGDSGTLTITVPIKHGGPYRLTGVANFAGAESAARTLSFRVGSQGAPLLYELAAAGAGVVLVLVLFSLFVAARRRRRPGSPPGHDRVHIAPRYTATHPRVLHVPLTEPVGSAPGRSHRRR